jgi:glucan phosphoethanolaminetransferase (alkaline phosphatase superfamily)
MRSGAHFWKYITSIKTVTEFIRLGLLGTYSLINIGSEDGDDTKTVKLVMVLTFISYFNFLIYLRWMKNFRVFFELLFASFKDIMPFLLVLIIMLLSFTSAFWNINRKDPRLLGPKYCGKMAYKLIAGGSAYVDDVNMITNPDIPGGEEF